MQTDSAKTVAETICELQDSLLEKFPECVVFGLGVNDPKRVFGTTKSLVEKHSELRVFETPTAENSSLGIAVGLSISGFKPIVVHQRVDFFLLAMDQLVNSAAKWRFMFGDKYETSMIIRLIAGRGWGQGPTHSQNLQALFAHIPGISVYYPSSPNEFRSVFENAFNSPYPTIVMEDRWVHQNSLELGTKERIQPEISYGRSARVLTDGDALTLVSFGYNTIVAFKVVEFFEKLGVNIELVNLVSIKPVDFETLISSVKKTKRMIIVDSGFEIASVSSYIAYQVNKICFSWLKSPIEVLSAGDYPEPTSYGVIDLVKVNKVRIAEKVVSKLGIKGKLDLSVLTSPVPDVPEESFFGPF